MGVEAVDELLVFDFHIGAEESVPERKDIDARMLPFVVVVREMRRCTFDQPKQRRPLTSNAVRCVVGM